MLLYLAQEGRGIGLLNKLKAYNLQDKGLDTVDANLELGLPVDLRDYGIGAQILVDLGLTSIRILTNNPKKIRGLEGYGLSVTDQIPIQHAPNPHNEAYLRAKRDRLGHSLHHQGLALDEEMVHERARPRPTREAGARVTVMSDPAVRDRRRPLLHGSRRAARRRRAAGVHRGRPRARRRLRRAGRVRAAARRALPGRQRPLRRASRASARSSAARPTTTTTSAPRRRAGSRTCSCAPACRARSACSPSRTWTRRSRAPAAASATRASTRRRP